MTIHTIKPDYFTEYAWKEYLKTIENFKSMKPGEKLLRCCPIISTWAIESELFKQLEWTETAWTSLSNFERI